MTQSAELIAIGHLVLTRLLVAGEKGATLPQIKKDVSPLVEHRWTGPDWSELLERSLEALESEGALRRIKPLRGKTDLFRPTAEGTQQALEFLGVAEVPPRTTWASLKKTFLLARALGLSAPRGEALKKFASDTGFKAALLKAEFDLPLGEFPTSKEATDALYWKLVGLESNGHRKFDVKSLLAALFNRELGEHRQGPPLKEVDKLLAKKVEARRSDANEFRSAVFRQWIDRTAAAGATDGGPAAAPGSQDAKGARPLDLGTFARRVHAAACASREGRFGDDRVFISRLWRALEGDPATSGTDLDGFKRRLAEANQSRLLDLARADLVEAMDENDVRDSETHFLGATYHFVCTRLPQNSV